MLTPLDEGKTIAGRHAAILNLFHSGRSTIGYSGADIEDALLVSELQDPTLVHSAEDTAAIWCESDGSVLVQYSADGYFDAFRSIADARIGVDAALRV